MAFLHCHNCGWQQDDFWEPEGWNPIKSVENWRKSLFSEYIDEIFTTDIQFIKENGEITLREVVARQFEAVAKRIRNMKYRTYEEYKEKNPNSICPNCKQKQLDID